MYRGNLFTTNLFLTGLYGRDQDAQIVVDNAGPITLDFNYSTGDLLSADPDLAATAHVSLPGYVAAPKTFSGGQLTLRPMGVGTATLTVSYVDPQNGPTSITRRITVIPE